MKGSAKKLLRGVHRIILFASISASLTCNRKFDLNTPVETPTTVTITIHSNSVEPAAVFLRPGGQLTFENQDSLPHQMVSACSELNTGVLSGGASFVIRMPSTNKFCSYQDQTNASISGTVQLCTQQSLFSCQ